MRKAYITPCTLLVKTQADNQLLAGSIPPEYHGPAGGRRRAHGSYEEEWDDDEEIIEKNIEEKTSWEI